MRSDDSFWDGHARTRMSRRRLLAAGGAGAAAVALGAAACSDGGAKQQSDAAPRPGGTLRTGTTLPLSTGLDPHTELGTGLAIFPRIYGYMIHVDPRDDAVIYDHATSVEQPDAVTYVFALRRGARFQDMAPINSRSVTAGDVVRSIERFRDNQVVARKTWHTTVLDAVTAPDERTVRVTTRRPYAYSLAELGGISGGAILPHELLDDGSDLNEMAAGSGPFLLEANTAERIRIVRNVGYYRQPVPYLDAMEWTIFPDDAARVGEFESRGLDVTPARDKHEADQLRARSGEIEVVSQPSLSWLSIGLRVDRPPFSDPRVRGALDLAIDRDALIRDIGFGDGDLLGPVNPHIADGYWSLSRADVIESQGGAAPIADRRAAARALLEAAGAAKTTFVLQVADQAQLVDVASAIRQQLAQIGVSVVPDQLGLLPWFTNFRRGQFDATLISHPPYESPDSPTRLYHSGGPDATQSPFAFADPAIDSLVERSWGELDREARRSTLLDAQRLMINARPMLHLFASVGYESAWTTVRNRHPELVGSLAQYNYEQWLAR